MSEAGTGAALAPKQAWIRPRFRAASRLLFMLYVCRVPLLAGLLVLAAGALGDQIHEIARVYLLTADDPEGGGGVWVKLGAIYASLFLLSWTQMFWSRYALANRFPQPLANRFALRLAVVMLPPILAFIPWLGGAIAMAKAAAGLSGGTQTLANVMSWVVVALGIASVLLYYSKRRRQSIGHQPRTRADGRRAFGQADWLTVSLGLGVFIFIAAAVAPQQVGGSLGAIAMLLAACVALVPALTWLTASPRLPRWHWLTLLFGLAALWSAFDLNDNHELRRLESDANSPPSLQRRTVRMASGTTAARQCRTLPSRLRRRRRRRNPCGLFHRASPRGHPSPAFARHLFVVSGVSGGSVGAATFAGIVDASTASDAKTILTCSGELARRADFADRTEAVLKADYLGPLVSTMLFPDALQRLLRFGWLRRVRPRVR